MSYTLKLHRDVEKQLSRIQKNHRERLVKALRSLRVNPRPTGCMKLDRNLYRIREGQYRIIYGVFDIEIVVVVCKVARRTESTYRDRPLLIERAIKLLED